MYGFSRLNQIVVMSIFLLSAPTLFAEPRSETPDTAAFQQQILYYVNQYRAKRHLKPLTFSNAISEKAAVHSKQMAGHTIPFGHLHFDKRIKQVYHAVGQCQGGAENVAYYKLNAKQLVDAWVASPGHRRNIVGNYNMTGIGIAYGKKGWAYYTQIFVRTI